MAFLVNSPSLVTTGSTGDDYFLIKSAGLQGATINGLAGADTIEATGGGGASAGFLIDLAGGADLVTASSIGATGAGTILGGAGADSIFISGVSLLNVLKAGDGNDTLNLASAFDITGGTLNLGGGADLLSASTGFYGGAAIGLGAGADTMAVSGGLYSTATVDGGGGADSIVFSGVEFSTGILIKGGSGTGKDFIRGLALDTGATVKGGGGADTITLSGDATTGLNVAGGAGGDSITIDGVLAAETFFVGGGAGSDIVTLSASDNTTGAITLQGGGGADSINVSGGVTGNGLLIYGGAGADDIGLGTFVTGTGAAVAYSALTDSTVSLTDEISGSYVSGSEVQIDLSGAVTSTRLGSYNGTNVYISAGIATGFSADTLASAASLMDSALSDEGIGTLFTLSGGADYLFVQGGSSGTSDDLLVEINSGVGVSAASGLTLKASGAHFLLDYES